MSKEKCIESKKSEGVSKIFESLMYKLGAYVRSNGSKALNTTFQLTFKLNSLIIGKSLAKHATNSCIEDNIWLHY